MCLPVETHKGESSGFDYINILMLGNSCLEDRRFPNHYVVFIAYIGSGRFY